MRFSPRLWLCLLLTVAPLRDAHAHIRLTSPANWQTTDSDGNPQKQAPCGTNVGKPTHQITVVTGGSTLKVTWEETIYHPGHFRLAIAQNRGELVTPAAVVVSNNCESAEVQSPPVAPVLMDGLFGHNAPGTGLYEQEITVPDIACDNCTLQLLQFMSDHAPSCFYYQCATLRILPSDGGTAPPPQVILDDGGIPPESCNCAASASGAAFSALWLIALAARRKN